MKIVSLNAGLPRTVRWKGREVITGIFKAPVEGPLMLRRLNLAGDRQADLENHGGVPKAVYAYPSEHYEFWRAEFPGMDLPWSMFGENLTTEGLREEDTNIGDRFRAGQAVLMATQPRIPCYKLGLKFGRDDIVKKFLESNRSGIYFAVLEEGVVNTGDSIERIHRDSEGITVAEINRAYVNTRDHRALVRRAARHEALPAGLRGHFLGKLSSVED